MDRQRPLVWRSQVDGQRRRGPCEPWKASAMLGSAPPRTRRPRSATRRTGRFTPRWMSSVWRMDCSRRGFDEQACLETSWGRTDAGRLVAPFCGSRSTSPRPASPLDGFTERRCAHSETISELAVVRRSPASSPRRMAPAGRSSTRSCLVGYSGCGHYVTATPSGSTPNLVPLTWRNGREPESPAEDPCIELRRFLPHSGTTPLFHRSTPCTCACNAQASPIPNT